MTASGDNLRQIKGIGAATAARLQEAGIDSFAALAAATPQELAGITGMAVERIKALGWIEQARAMTGNEHNAQLPEQQAEERLRYATFTLELTLDAEQRVRRTRISHVQDGDEAKWPGWDDQALLAFIHAHAELDLAEPPAPPGAAPPDVAALDLVASTPDIAEIPPTPAAPTVRRLRISFDVQLRGMPSQRPSGAVPYLVQLLAHEIEHGQTLTLAADQGQINGTAPQQVALEIAMPAVGRYQLQGTVILPEQQLFLEIPGPVLRVVP